MHQIEKELASYLGHPNEKGVTTNYGRVVIKRDRMPTKTESGLHLADTFEKSNWCTIAAVPNKVTINGKEHTPVVKPGDRVFIEPQDSQPLLSSKDERDFGEVVEGDFEITHYSKLIAKDHNNPMENKVVIKVKKEERISAGGIILVKNEDLITRFREDTGRGTVVSTHYLPDCVDRVNPSDDVYYIPNESPWLDEDHVVVDAKNILGVVGSEQTN